MCPHETRTVGRGESVSVTATTSGFTSDYSGSCGGDGTPEFVLQLDVTGFGFYDLSTAGSDFDNVLYVRSDTCSGTETACQNAVAGPGGESLTLTPAHAGTFYVFVDGAPGVCGGMVDLSITGR